MESVCHLSFLPCLFVFYVFYPVFLSPECLSVLCSSFVYLSIRLSDCLHLFICVSVCESICHSVTFNSRRKWNLAKPSVLKNAASTKLSKLDQIFISNKTEEKNFYSKFLLEKVSYHWISNTVDFVVFIFTPQLFFQMTSFSLSGERLSALKRVPPTSGNNRDSLNINFCSDSFVDILIHTLGHVSNSV